MAIVSGPNVTAQLNETCHTINNITDYEVVSCKSIPPTLPSPPPDLMMVLIKVLAGVIAMLIVVATVLGVLLTWKVFHSKKCRTNIEAPTATVSPPSITLTNEPSYEPQDQPPPVTSLPNQPEDIPSLSSTRPPPYAHGYVGDHTFSQGYGSMASDSASRIACQCHLVGQQRDTTSININRSNYASINDDSGIIVMFPQRPAASAAAEPVIYIVHPVQQTTNNSNTLHNNSIA